ncbi:hypothetical protein [Serratia bockelmannii]|uniref:hypothetical protein n=1 Tax=Serratia bockelmannii TaxID=2703793 RepID=UPI003FA6E4A8
MTLTTEQLRARAKIWRKKAVDAKWISVSITQDMLLNADAFDELANNREAQPVAWRHDDGPFAGITITRSKSVADNWIANGWVVTPLYTAPQAPAVPDGFKLVPTVPTPEMIAAAMNCDDVTFINLEDFCVNFGNIYAAMLAAAPGTKE